MARDTDALKIRKWAATGDRVDPDDSRISPRLNRAKGWPASFSQAGGDVPRREVFNQLFAEITGMLHEINRRGGILEHSSVIDYQHPAIVARNDGQIFISRRTNGPSTNNAGAPPTGSTNQNANWKNLLSFITIPAQTAATPDASTTVKGKIEIATVSEATTGTDTVRAVTPAGLQAGLDALQTTIQAIIDAIEIPGGAGNASLTSRGIVELATVTEADNQTDAVRAVTPAGLAKRAKLASPTFTGTPKAPTAGANENSKVIATTAWVKARISGLVSNASATVRGIVELATVSEAKTGTDTARAVTPAGLQAGLDALQVTIQAIIDDIEIPDGVGAATTIKRGTVELATVTEADNQTDAVRAVTPAGLAKRAKLASPTFTGTPKAPTPGANVNNTQIPTTAWVKARIAGIVSNASTTVRGIVELATVSEAKTGTDTARAVTPAGLKGGLDALQVTIQAIIDALVIPSGVGNATTTARGSVELATTTEADNQTDSVRAVTPSGLASRAKLASPTFTGTPKAPTPGANVNNTQIPTTAWVKARIAGLVSNASTTVRGIVELATITEAKNGTDTERAVTPAGLKAATGNVRETWLYWNSSGLSVTSSTSGSSITLLDDFDSYRMVKVYGTFGGNNEGVSSSYVSSLIPVSRSTSRELNFSEGHDVRLWGSGSSLKLQRTGACKVHAIIGVI